MNAPDPTANFFFVILAPDTQYYGVGHTREAAQLAASRKVKPHGVDICTFLCHGETVLDNGRLIAPKKHPPILLDTKPGKKPKEPTKEELRKKASAAWQGRVSKAEEELYRNRRDSRRRFKDNLKAARDKRRKLRHQMPDNREYAHGLMDAQGEQMKTLFLTKSEAEKRNTALRGSGFSWRLLNTLATG